MTDLHDPPLAGAKLAQQYRAPDADTWSPPTTRPAFTPYQAAVVVERRRWWQPKPKPAELAYLADCAVIREASWPESRRVVVLNPKSSLKTPSSVILAGVLGLHRGGFVVAWDASESAGTLHSRVGGTQLECVSEVAEHPDRYAAAAAISRAVATQTSHSDVMGSLHERQFTAKHIQNVTNVLTPHYRIQIADTGSNAVHSDAQQELIRLAHLIVVPTTLTADSVNKAAELVWRLKRNPKITAPVQVIISQYGTPVTQAEAQKMLTNAGADSISTVPYDPHIEAGTLIDPAKLTQPSTYAWTRTAAGAVAHLKGTNE